MCIFANEGGPKSKSSRKETPLKIQKYKEKHESGKNLEKMFLAPTPTGQELGQTDEGVGKPRLQSCKCVSGNGEGEGTVQICGFRKGTKTCQPATCLLSTL